MHEKVQQIMETAGASYWDIRQEEISSMQAVAWNGTMKEMATVSQQGIGIRVLYGTSWGFAHTTSVNEVEKTAQRAIAIAHAMNKARFRKDRAVQCAKPVKDSISTSHKINPADISLEEKKKLVVKASRCHESIRNLQIMYSDITRKKFFANSEGTEIQQDLLYTYYGAEATAASGDRMESVYKAHGALQGYEITDGMMAKVDEACATAKNLLSASVPKGGAYPVIADGPLTGVFIHEALGHAAEADNLLCDSTCLKGHEQKQVGSNAVTVYDDATIAGSWGSFFYDDEGIPSHKTKIMDKGIFSSYIHSRETAALMEKPMTGNARAQGCDFLPIVRMSNTYIDPGDADFDEMVSDVKSGIYLRGSKGGQVNPITGDFQFSAQDGFLISNGELGTYLRAVSLAGNVLQIIRNIAQVEDKFDGGFPGHCGKNGQSVPVHGENPSIFITNAVVGGR